MSSTCLVGFVEFPKHLCLASQSNHVASNTVQLRMCQAALCAQSGTFCHDVQVGAERYNLFTGCPKAKTATMVLRGGSEQFIDEAERSLHDAIMIVRRAVKNASVVPGGGAIDMEISKYNFCVNGSPMAILLPCSLSKS